MLETLHAASAEQSAVWLNKLQAAAVANDDIFAVLMEATKVCSLGQLNAAMLSGSARSPASLAVFEVGGRYRRNM